jgi:hypothetical protein
MNLTFKKKMMNINKDEEYGNEKNKIKTRRIMLLRP